MLSSDELVLGVNKECSLELSSDDIEGESAAAHVGKVGTWTECGRIETNVYRIDVISPVCQVATTETSRANER